MTPSSNELPFNRYQSNVHSQNGEDGVVAEINRRLNVSADADNWCVEFGAWDGIHLSNTFQLVERGWNAIYIEGDRERYNDLLTTAGKYPKIIPVNAFVARFSADELSLDSILGKTEIPAEFTLLSIDIDSYDCDVWESLKNYTPKIVIIEINSSVPPGVVWRHSEKTKGNTFSATCRVAEKKGYTLVCHTGNLIFVRDDLIEKLNIDKRYIDYPELLFQFDSVWVPSNMFPEPRAISLIKEFAVRLTPKPLLPIVKRTYRAIVGVPR
ncbi:hypothetical protein [Paraburkholderia lacunae]|uniref:Methyltransferase FkbM domain-containing protein n=1 Tax=Paraburkholderia lacunae TaxID=2211104 RepID=A0A370N1R5_9BURK|nr:hypothetical protein [Paraburkholderia lacunae]RDJ99563.1 hypothetical protein DLM46_28250 [Paraburkholderia lacunae]